LDVSGPTFAGLIEELSPRGGRNLFPFSSRMLKKPGSSFFEESTVCPPGPINETCLTIFADNPAKGGTSRPNARNSIGGTPPCGKGKEARNPQLLTNEIIRIK
jgi:hypothetical protein